MLICNIMGEICLVVVQQKINSNGFLYKECSGSILKNDPLMTNK